MCSSLDGLRVDVHLCSIVTPRKFFDVRHSWALCLVTVVNKPFISKLVFVCIFFYYIKPRQDTRFVQSFFLYTMLYKATSLLQHSAGCPHRKEVDTSHLADTIIRPVDIIKVTFELDSVTNYTSRWLLTSQLACMPSVVLYTHKGWRNNPMCVYVSDEPFFHANGRTWRTMLMCICGVPIAKGVFAYILCKHMGKAIRIESYMFIIVYPSPFRIWWKILVKNDPHSLREACHLSILFAVSRRYLSVNCKRLVSKIE